MWLLKPRAFHVTRNNEPINSHYVKHGVDPNIRYGRILPSLVPLYEEQEALLFANYNRQTWKVLPYEERAFHVAHYRLHRLVELHGSDAVNDKMVRDQKNANKSGKR